MTMTDPLADMITHIRNGQQAKLVTITTPASKLRKSVLNVLEKEGYIGAFEEVKGDSGHPQFKVNLKYYEGKPVIQKISRVSKPGRRNYSGSSDLPKSHNGLGIMIVSTSKGVMTDYDARVANVGGEVLCEVY